MANNKDNQHCLNCAHFQPYENADPVDTANGECRFRPRVGPAVDSPTAWSQYFPYVADGKDFWCAKWKLSLLPAINQSGSRPASWPADWTAFQQNPWNRRESLNQSCWNCNNFQHESAVDLDGQCRCNPTPPTIDITIGVTSATLQPTKSDYDGTKFWCSCWEINANAPEPPQQ